MLWIIPLSALLQGSVTLGLEFSYPASHTNHPIVLVHDPRATKKLRPDAERVNEMVDRAMTELKGTATPREAWQTLADSNDVVAIKVFAAPSPSTGTRIPVVTAVVRGLISAGVVNTNIIVWDHSIADLHKAGFDRMAEATGITLAGALQAGYDENTFYTFALVTGLRFGDLEFGKIGEGIGRRSFVTKLLGPQVTKLISIAPASNKHSTGVTGHLYNMTLASVDNTWRFESNPTTLPWVLPELYAMRSIGDRVVLCVTDALICQYLGEKATLLHYSEVANQLYFGTDPVAMDLRAIRLLETQRRASDSVEIQANLDTYRNAALLQLGVDDPDLVPLKQISLGAKHPQVEESSTPNLLKAQP